MALNKIKTGSITDDAVNSDKLAAGSVTSSELNKTAITGQTELSETANDADFAIIFDASSSTLKKVLRSNLKQAAATISSISPTTVNDTTGTSTFTITGTGFTAGTTARLIGNGGQVQEFDTVTRSSATSITATLANATLNSNGSTFTPYDVQVTNGEGIATLLANQISFNANPVFTTAAGSLGSGRTSMSGISVNATDPESAGNVTFDKQSGALPPGISLVNTAAEGGTALFSGTISPLQSSDTVFNFVLRASDAASNTSSRAFSFTALGPQVTSFTSSGTFTVPSGVTTLTELLVVAGGAGGGQPGPGGGGGAGGLVFMPNYPVTAGGTIAVTVGSGGNGGQHGQDSTFGNPGDPGLGQGGVIRADAGGVGGCAGGGNAAQGGSGGGGGRPSNGGQGLQSTLPGNSGAYGFGSNGGQGSGNAGGGGGGAGAAGTNGSNSSPASAGNGGAGKAYTIADGTSSVFYAGGGGGAWHTGGPSGNGSGGQGGGAPGHTSAQANTGGGGGGASNAGGKGIVIVRF